MTQSFKPVAKQIILPDFIYLNNDNNDKLFIEKACIKLLDGTYGNDFEKLSPSNLYSMRLEQKGRIILAKLIIGGISTVVLLECRLDHKYERAKSLLLPTAELNHHINKCAAGKVYVLNEDGIGLSMKEQANTPPQPLIEYGGQYIEPSEAQYGMLLQTKENDQTEVVCGEAGSGKTLILMHRIASLAQTLATDEASTRKIWVIVPHTPLQLHLELEWKNQLIYSDIEAQRQTNPTLQNPVHIVTPDIFYRRLDGIPDTVQSKDHRDFITWLSPEALTTMQRAFGRVSPMQVYQELCFFNGLVILHNNQQEAEKAYNSPELTKALLDSTNKQQAAQELARLLSKYQAHLANNNGFDAYVYQPQNQLPEQDYFFEDEAQNLPPSLLKVPNALIAMNDSQSIRFRRRANEILLTYVNKGSITYNTLPGTHRCPKQPIDLASRVDAFTTQYINPKRKSASTSVPLKTIHPDEGFVCFVGNSNDEIAMLRQVVQEPDTAVVYLTHEAENQFKDLGIIPISLFTPDNPILGLEFKRVIIISPFNTSFAREIRNGELTNNQIAAHELYLNTLKAAMTRATDTLVLFQPQAHETETLVNYFKKEAPWTTATLQTMTMTPEERATLFYEQAKKLYREGQREMALGIIRHSQQDIDAFLREMLPNCQPLSVTALQEAMLPVSEKSATPSRAEKSATSSSAEKSATPSSAEKSAKSTLSATAADTDVAQSNPVDITTPLKEDLKQYVEQFYEGRVYETRVIEKNFIGLLKHSHAATMLFHHKMQNGNCLFINLLFANKLDVLNSILQKKDSLEAQNLNMAISTIKEEDYFLRFSLSSIKSCDTHAKKLTIDDIRRLGVGELFKEGDGEHKMQFLLQQLSINQLNPQELAHQACRTDGSFAPSFLHLLALNDEQWIRFLNNKNAAKIFQAHFANHSSHPTPNYSNVVLRLLQTFNGMLWLNFYVKIIISFATPTILLETIPTGQRPSVLSWLFANHPDKCNFDIIKMCLDKDRLFTPITENSSTPFTILCSTPEGCKLIIKHWDNLKAHLCNRELPAETTSVLNNTADGQSILKRLDLPVAVPVKKPSHNSLYDSFGFFPLASPAESRSNHKFFSSATKDKSEEDMKNQTSNHSTPKT